MIVKDRILQAILLSNKVIINPEQAIHPMLVPVICFTMVGVVMLILFIMFCTRNCEHESDVDELWELSELQPNKCNTNGPTEINSESLGIQWLPRKQSLSPIPEILSGMKGNSEGSENMEVGK